MLPSGSRLLKNKEFQSVFKKGKFFKSKVLSLRVLKNNLDKNRFGFVVSNKISKKSVERHKIKRRLIGIVKLILPKLEKGFDFVIITFQGIKEKTYKEIKKEMFFIFGVKE